MDSWYHASLIPNAQLSWKETNVDSETMPIIRSDEEGKVVQDIKTIKLYE